MRYKTAEKEAQLREQQFRVRRRTTQLLAGLLAAVLLVGVAYLLYNRHQLRLHLHHEQERQHLIQQRMAAVLAAAPPHRLRPARQHRPATDGRPAESAGT